MTVRDEEAWVTAYALGELEGQDRVKFEARLAEDAALREEVEALRALSRDLTSALTANAPVSLSAERRLVIERALTATQSAREEPTETSTRRTVHRASRFERAPWLFSGVLAAAAALAVFAGPMAKSERESTAVSAPTAGPAGVFDQWEESPQSKTIASPAPTTESEGVKDLEGKRGDSRAFGGWYCDPRDPACGDLSFRNGDDGLTDHDKKFGTQRKHPAERPFTKASADSRSTFSVDVDTASYSLLRRKVTDGVVVAPETIRIEEMLNAFRYAYPEPKDAPIGVNIEATATPWSPSHRLVRIGLRAREAPLAARPASNLVFLIDVSGSMSSPDRLPLLKRGLGMLAASLDARDRVAIVAYAGTSGVVLPSTPGDRHRAIEEALAKLAPGGATDGSAGIELAYAEAQKGFVKGGINRVLLATDGDFNLGMTDGNALARLIRREAKGGVFLSVLGVGMGDLRDNTLELLADDGNGFYAYLDSEEETRRVLVEQASGTLVTVAKDVKVEVTWDPSIVSAFRLIGYDNRRLDAAALRDDTKDAGDMGAGHRVTALYEVVLHASENDRGKLGALVLRFKRPDADVSEELRAPIVDGFGTLESASIDTKFAASVAAFGLKVRGSPAVESFGFPEILRLAAAGRGNDALGERRAFSDLVAKFAERR